MCEFRIADSTLSLLIPEVCKAIAGLGDEFIKTASVMRGNTNPCSVCDYCDDSCDVCLHQAYEDTVAGRYREAAAPSSDEEGAWGGGASTDVDSASDEEGSWFTTPWSQLITQRVAGYEVDPAIGVQLAPLEDDEDGEDEQRAKEERHRRWAAAHAEVEGDGDGDGARARGRRLRRRRRRRRGDSPAAAPEPAPAVLAEDAAEKGAEDAANGEVPAASPDGAEPAANDEGRAGFSDGAAQPASTQVREEGDAAVPKDTHNNMWRATVHSYVSVVSVS
ncbi:Protein of unknown function, partial [Gryllus bimaculatus]